MNWFKRLLNKVSEEEPMDEIEKDVHIQTDEEDTGRGEVGRPKFRFPLIPDGKDSIEVAPFLEEPAQPTEQKAPERFSASGGRLPLPKHLRSRERDQERLGTNGFSQSRKSPIRPRAWEEAKRTAQSMNPIMDEQPQPPKRTRGFMPSEVPSPVYGFKKKPAAPPEQERTGLADLIQDRKETTESRHANDISQQNYEAFNLPLPQSLRAATGHREDAAPVQMPPVSEPTPVEPKEEESDDLIVAKVSELMGIQEESDAFPQQESAPDLSVAPEVAEMEETGPVQNQQDDPETASQSPSEVPEEQEETARESTENVVSTKIDHPKRKSGTPFNVVMLKSDRLRLEQLERLKGLKAVHPVEESPQPEQEKKASEPVSTISQQQPVQPEKDIVPNESRTPAAVVDQDPPETGRELDSSQVNMEDEVLPYYVFPDKKFLIEPEAKPEDSEWMESQAAKLEEALSYFSVKGNVIGMVQGPAVTQFELKVGHGTKVSKIRNLQDDLKLALAAKDIRIQAPIPGRSSIGIEIPNRMSRPVRISEVIDSAAFNDSESPLEAVLGLDLAGRPSTIDLRKMPHGLIAGATGSGKSVCINSILTSLLYKASPEELRLLLIDPKMVELAPYNRIPHLVSPVITDVKAANAALKWAVEEMERRYELFAHSGVRDISRYNQKAEDHREFSKKLPYLLIVIDELADLMMIAPAEVEESICRIAQKARACGIHLVIATQRPSVDVITGLIKANVPTRIAFSVSSQVDSRTIIDVPGAERLLGRGDMLYLGNGMSAPARLQGTFVTDDEIEQVTEFVRRSGEPNYLFRQEELIKKAESHESEDPLFEEACRFIAEAGSASTSMLQRKFSIGYNRAARLIDMLEDKGFVSPQKGSKPRDVYLTEEAAAAIEQPGGPAHTI